MSSPSDIQAAIDAGRATADLKARSGSVEHAGGSVALILREANQVLEMPAAAIRAAFKTAPAPIRHRGIANLTERDSFIAHVNRFKSDASVVFADTEQLELTAVLNYSSAAESAWGDHRAEYSCPLSAEWQTWSAANESWVSQDQLADFLEANHRDIHSPADSLYPPPSQLLSMARELRIHSKGTFERTVNPTTGEYSLVNKQESDVSSTRIPPAFLIGIPVFEAGAGYKIECRLQMKFEQGRPCFRFVMQGAAAAKRDAFGEVREAVATGTGLPVLAGAPEPVQEPLV